MPEGSDRRRVIARRRCAVGRGTTRRSTRSRTRLVKHWAASLGCAMVIAGTQAFGVVASPAGASSAANKAAGSLRVVSVRPSLLSGSRHIGELSGQLVSGEIALSPRDAAGLASYADAVSTPGSRQYHHYLPAGAFAALFGPAPSTVREAIAVLRSAGLRVGEVSGNGLLVAFSGSAGRVAAAFHSHLERYELASGRLAIANDSPLRLPASFAPFVQAVIGLDTLTTPGSALAVRNDSVRNAGRVTGSSVTDASTAPKACQAATSDANNRSGFTDAQIATAYGLDGLYGTDDSGAGQTIAIYELEPFRTKDISAFDTCYFGAPAAAKMLARVHTVAVDGGDPSGPGLGESELDIEDVSALAPGATLEVYEAPNTNTGYLANFNQIIEDDTAKLVTSSWFSGCETAVATEQPGLEQVENTIFEQAAAQGQTVLEAAGDAGSDGCAHNSDTPAQPLLSSSDPASQPYVLAVGGTTLNDATQPPNKQVWNDGASGGGGGGGISAMWPSPAWQVASKVPGIDDTSLIIRADHVSGGDFCQSQPGLTASTLCREVPDVSADADEYTGAVTADFGGQWATVGGTSSAAPLWTAMLAEVDATPSCVAHKGFGFVPPLLYQIASIPAEYTASFNDITVSNNDVFGGNDRLYPATKGYDMASGLGSPELTGPGGSRGLAYYLCASASPTRPVVSSVSPPVISSAETASLTIRGSGFESAGSPDVAGVTVGTYDARSAAISVTSGTRLTVAVPAGAVQEGGGSYDVSVTLTGGTTSLPDSRSRLVVYNDPGANGQLVPVVAALDPSGGPESGGSKVTIYGSGFEARGAATKVTFGGVPATKITVDSDSQITAVVPPYSATTGGTSCRAGNDPATDVCQSELQVTAHGRTSAESTLAREYTGVLPAAASATGLMPAPTEFDYLPAPQVTGIRFPAGERPYASNVGFTIVTLTGVGLGQLGLEWIDVGTPGSSAAMDEALLSVSPTAVQLLLPPSRQTKNPETVQVAAQTLASPNLGRLTSAEEPSRSVGVVYAPQPTVTSISTPNHLLVGPDSGGTRITIRGSGFGDGPFVEFENETSDTFGTDYNVTPSRTSPNTELSVTTTPELQGIYAVIVCNQANCAYPAGSISTFCSPAGCVVIPGTDSATFTFYPPGNPKVTAVEPKSGRAGQQVTILGDNLGYVQAVYFGPYEASEYENGINFATFSQENNVVVVVVPKGAIGKTVDVSVVTAESAAHRDPKSPNSATATFTYTGPKPKKRT